MTLKDTTLPPAPESFADNTVHYGRFAGPIADVSTAQWDGTSGLFSPRRRQRKAWLYFGIYSERFTMGFAVVDAGYAGTGFVYVYDHLEKRLWEEKATAPLAFEKTFAPSLYEPWRFATGARRWSIEPATSASGATVWNCTFRGKQISLEFELEGGREGMTAVVPSPKRPFAHTYKECALPGQLNLHIAGKEYAESGLGIVDFTLGYPPRHTMWNWAAAAGESEGRRIGLNLVANFNNGLENVLWIDGHAVPLPQALFVYENERTPWRVSTLDGAVDLRFQPAGCRGENLRLGVFESRFMQPFGVFSGTLRARGEVFSVQLPGVVEEHFAVW